MIVERTGAIAVQTGEFTTLLRQCSSGNREALDALTPIVYAELRKLAVSFMRNERPGITLQPTALIHEAYLQLVEHDLPDFENRAHFFGVAAHIMRRLLIASARKYRAQKRGGGNPGEMHDDIPIPARQVEELLAVDEALDRLARQDARKAKVIELKYFGGLSREEIAETLGLTLGTVKRDVMLGEAWLRRALSAKPPRDAV
jgi:RNA polymerase sigma factor (TIGR02999 family)